MIIKLEKESKYGVIQCHTCMHGVKKTTDSYKFCLNEWYVAAELATYDNNRVLQQHRVCNYNYKYYYKTIIIS